LRNEAAADERTRSKFFRVALRIPRGLRDGSRQTAGFCWHLQGLDIDKVETKVQMSLNF